MDNHCKILLEALGNLSEESMKSLNIAVSTEDLKFLFLNLSQGQDTPDSLGGYYQASHHFDNSAFAEGIELIQHWWKDIEASIIDHSGTDETPYIPPIEASGGLLGTLFELGKIVSLPASTGLRLVRLEVLFQQAPFIIPLSKMFHAIQDFYSHSNWIDEQLTVSPINTINFLQLMQFPDKVPNTTKTLWSGTYKDNSGANRISDAPNHEDLNKDNDSRLENLIMGLSSNGSKVIGEGSHKGKTRHALAVEYAVESTSQILKALADKIARLGSYRSTTQDVKIKLFAEMKDGNGEDSLDITNYDGVNDIANINGYFKIINNKVGKNDFKQSKFGRLVPNGSYLLSIKTIRVEMQAKCLDRNGAYRLSRVDITNFDRASQDISNINGKLELR